MSALCVSAFLLSSPLTTAQVVTDGEGDVMIGGTVSDPSGIFELISTTKGFLLPRMTEVQRDAVVSPASALMIFNTDSGEFQYWDADTDQWEIFVTSVNLSDFGWLITGNEELTTWNGSSGNFLGTTGDNALVLMTQEEQEIQFWTNNMQRALFSSDGNFLPDTNNTYSLGTDTNRWSEVFVAGGSVHIGDTVGTREMILGYQEVNGTTTGTIGVNGTPSMNITTTEVNFTGNTDVDGTLTVDDITTLTGNVDAMNGLDVTGADLTVGGAEFIVNNIGNTVIGGTLTVDNATTLSGLDVTGNTGIAGTLAVVGVTTLIRNVDAQAGLDVTGADLTVGDTNFTVDNAGNTDIAGTLVVDDSVTFRGNVDAMDGLDVTGADLTVGDTNFTVDNAGNTGIAGTLVVDDSVLVVDDSVTFRGNVDAQAGLDVTGNTDIDGATTLGSGDATDEVTVNTDDTGTDLVISEGGVDRSSSTVQTFAIDNSDSDSSYINVLINGATSTTNSRLTVNDGHWTSQQGTPPTVTSGTSNVTIDRDASSTDVAGSIRLRNQTAGSIGAGTTVTVTFNEPYEGETIVVLTPASSDAADVDVYVTSGTDNFVINGFPQLSAGSDYVFNYHVIETN